MSCSSSLFNTLDRIELIETNFQGTPIVQVKGGFEPLLFTCHFVGWDVARSSKAFDDPAAKRASAIVEAKKKEDEAKEKEAEEY